MVQEYPNQAKTASAALWRHHRVVMHADMDAFYASIEQREHPDLRGRPVIVGGPRDARGVVVAASYEARASGVRAAMPLRTAARLCPQGVFLRPRMQLYAEVSRRVLDIFGSYAPLVEPLSLDEAFLDVTGCERRYGSPARLAAHLRAAVWGAERLTVSVGVAATKSVAKIASDLRKPDGCVVIPPGQESHRLAPLPVRVLWGIGPKTAQRLARRGIRTVGDLLRQQPAGRETALGAVVAKAARLACGDDPRAVSPVRQRKSVGNEVTFARDLADPDLVVSYLQQLADHVSRRLREKRLRGRAVALKLRYANFQTLNRQLTLDQPVDSARDIRQAVLRLFARLDRPRQPYRLVGVHVSGLTPAGYEQLPLVGGPERGAGELDRALDAIRDRFGDAAVTAASLLGSEARLDSDRYAWRDAVLA